MIEEKIPVQILGQTYEILGDPADALYYHSLAQYVEAKMREIMQHTHIVSSQKIAVLAALNITDELFHDRQKKNDSGKNLDKKHQDWLELLDQVLEEGGKDRKSAPVAAAVVAEEAQEFKLDLP